MCVSLCVCVAFLQLKASLAEQLSVDQLRAEFRKYIKTKIAQELIDFYQDSLDREEVEDFFERQVGWLVEHVPNSMLRVFLAGLANGNKNDSQRGQVPVGIRGSTKNLLAASSVVEVWALWSSLPV